MQEPGNNAFPETLDELIEWWKPNALAIEGIRHDDRIYTLVVLDLDYTYTVWLASLSLDNRWTLSPRPNAKVLEVTDMP